MPKNPNEVTTKEVQVTLSRSDEQHLINRIAQGDKDAFNPLFNQYYKKIANYLEYRQRLPHDVAKDIANNVMLDLWENVRNKKYQQNASLYTYLVQCAINQANTWRKKERRSFRKNAPNQNFSIINSSEESNEKAAISQEYDSLDKENLIALVREILAEIDLVDFLTKRFQMPQEDAQNLSNGIIFDFTKKHNKNDYIYHGREPLKQDLLTLVIKKARYWWENPTSSESINLQTNRSQEAPWEKALELAMASLNKEERTVVGYMLEIEGEGTQRYIVEKTSWSLGKVSTRVNSAKAKLMAALSDDNDSKPDTNPTQKGN